MKVHAALALAAALLAGCAGEPAADAEPVDATRVAMTSTWEFDPPTIRVPVGVDVEWVNEGSAHHTVTLADGTLDRDLAPGENVTHAFTAPGEYAYECKYHVPGMTGKVIATEAADA